MKNRYIAVFILLSLLSQQLMAGVVSAAMMGSVSSDQLSSSMGDMSHQHHDMSVQSDMSEMSSSQAMDCCATDCAYCIAGCYSVLSSQLIKKLSIFTQIPLQQSNSEPLVQSPESLFRPPIFA